MTMVSRPAAETEQMALLRPVIRAGLGLLALVIALLIQPALNPAVRAIGTTGFMLSVLAQSWNVLGGLAGYASFGQVVFFGAGGYGVALLMTRASMSFWLALSLATLIACAFGLALGPLLLRLRGQYFALATLVLAAALSSAAGSFSGFTGGLPGLVITTVGTHRPTPYPGAGGFYIIFLVMAAVTTVAVAWVRHSRFGLALRLVRENEEVAGEFGIPVTRVKVAAFALSAMLAGAAGGVFGFQQVTVTPTAMFDSSLTALPIAIAVLGGLGSVAGPVICALLLGAISAGLTGPMQSAHTLIIGLLIMAAAFTDPRSLLRRLRARRAARPSPPDGSAVGQPTAATDRGANTGQSARPRVSPWSRAGRRVGPATLDLADVSVRFGGVQAVRGVSLHIGAGQMIGILGPNGAGKSTLLDAIGGRSPPAAGRIWIDQRDITGASPWRLARAGIARTHQVPTPLWGLSVEENVAAGLLFRCRSARAARMRTERLLAWADLLDRRHDTPASLGVAELRRLDLARAAVARPRVLLIDEPLAGVDSEITSIVRMITDLRDRGATVVLVEHTLDAVLRLCDAVLVLHHGHPLAFGAPHAVLSQDRVIGAYLGQRLNLSTLV